MTPSKKGRFTQVWSGPAKKARDTWTSNVCKGTHDQLLPGKVNIVNGAADDDGTFPYGRDVRVTCVRKQDGCVGAMHDELQRDVVLQFTGHL